MSEKNENVWAPWRMEYIAGLEGDQDDGGCFLCRYHETPADDVANHLLWRSEHTLTLLNRFPYTNGHLLVAPALHCAEPENLPDEVWIELTQRVRDAKRVLQHVVHAHGFNIGMNLSRCAGAGLPDHLHWHVVPRWNGDTNFMAVAGGVRVIPQALEAVAKLFRETAAELKLPT